MSDDPRDAEPDQAFFDTDEPEARAFGKPHTGRKVFLMIAILATVIAAGVGMGWAISSASNDVVAPIVAPAP